MPVAGRQGGSTPKRAWPWHPLLRAPSCLGWGHSAAISQNNRIRGTPLCERVLRACPLSTLKRWLMASCGQVTGLSTAYSFEPENKGAEEQMRAPPQLLWERDPDFRPGSRAPRGKPGPSPTWVGTIPAACRACLAVILGFRGRRGAYSPRLVILFLILRLLLHSVSLAFALRGGCPNTYTYLVLITNSGKLHGNSKKLTHSLST